MQHAIEGMQRGQVEFEKIALRNHPQDEQDHCAPDGMRVNRAVALLRPLPLGKGERKRHSHHEHEEGPNHIERMQSLPAHMLKLGRQARPETVWPHLGETPDHELTADNPQHVEAA